MQSSSVEYVEMGWKRLKRCRHIASESMDGLGGTRNGKLTDLSTVKEKGTPCGPFAHACMASAGTAFRQESLAGPGVWVQFTAFAIESKAIKLEVAGMATAVLDCIIAARKRVS